MLRHPCAPTLRREPPRGDEWAHEIKWDGWRLQAHNRPDGVTLYSRPSRDITAIPAISEAIAALSRRSLVLGGELVAFDDKSRPDFHLLRRKAAPVVAFVFDIIESNGADLRGRPWRERRRFLKHLFPPDGNSVLQLNQVGATALRCCAVPGRTALRVLCRSTEPLHIARAIRTPG